MSNALPFAFVPMVFIIILAIYVFSSFQIIQWR